MVALIVCFLLRFGEVGDSDRCDRSPADESRTDDRLGEQPSGHSASRSSLRRLLLGFRVRRVRQARSIGACCRPQARIDVVTSASAQTRRRRAPDMGETKKQRREQAREHARVNREQAKRRRRRNRWFLQGGIGAGILAAAGVTLLIVSSVNAPTPAGKAPANTTAGAIAFHGENGVIAPTVPNPTTTVATTTKTPAQVDLYIDWSCPVCKQFETATAADLQTLVESEQATLAVHPVAILDHSYLGSRFSSRAANAAACVADHSPSSFLDVQAQMYDNQPDEGTRGLTTDRILELVHAGGASGSALDSCITDETYRGWVEKYTAKALADKSLTNPSTGGFGTPTALINGKRWNGGRDFIRSVEDAD